MYDNWSFTLEEKRLDQSSQTFGIYASFYVICKISCGRVTYVVEYYICIVFVFLCNSAVLNYFSSERLKKVSVLGEQKFLIYMQNNFL